MRIVEDFKRVLDSLHVHFPTIHFVCHKTFALTIVMKFSQERKDLTRAFKNKCIGEICGRVNRVDYAEWENRKWKLYETALFPTFDQRLDNELSKEEEDK